MNVAAQVSSRRWLAEGWAQTRLWWYFPAVVLAMVIARWGLGTRALFVVGAVGALGLLWLPSTVWAVGALLGALLSRVVTGSGFLPSLVNFVDFAFVFVGLSAILIRRGVGVRWTPTARRVGVGLLLLFGLGWLSWAMHPADLARPMVTFLLWAEPFALILILLIDPPGTVGRRALIAVLAMVIALQVPIGLYQAVTTENPDFVQGTLLGVGAGAHVMAGVTALGGVLLLSWGFGRSLLTGLISALVAGVLLIAMPLLADAKQVIFALPAAAVVLLWSVRGPIRRLLVVGPVVAAMAVLLILVPAGSTAVGFLDTASRGQTGKLSAFELVSRRMDGSISTWVLGLGPANGVSRAAFLTTDLFAQGDSPLAGLGLEPATLPVRAEKEAGVIAGGSSFNGALSSALGLFSDIGVLGLLTYGSLIGAIAVPLLRGRHEWLPRAALAGWALSFPLAVAFDWWEQPPFMLVLAAITGLALATTQPEQEGRLARARRS
jgi:hypothetical protein